MPELPTIHARQQIETEVYRKEILDLEFSNGERRKYERLYSRGHGAVMIAAIPSPGTVLLIREYAAGVHRYELGLPKGRMDAGETVLEAANRELKEETGFGARTLTHLRGITLAPGYMTHEIQLVLAEDLYEERLPGDEPEELEVVPWKLDALGELVLREDCSEGRSLAGLLVVREVLLGARMSRHAGDTPAADMLEAVLAIARRAGDAILAVYQRDFDVSHKDDRSPLTEADLAAHHLIVDGLGALDAGIPVLSEESATIPWDVRRAWTRYWLVDPLDGTREFVKKNGEFTVNIALIEHGAPVFGVVHAPVIDEAHIGLRGVGAWLDDASGRVPVAVRAPATTPLRIAGSRSHMDPRTSAAIARMGEVDLLSLGSSLKFCRLADARLDAYLRFAPTSEWDTAAGQAVLEAAGGCVLGLDGKPLPYNTKDSLLNPDFLALGDPALPWRSWLDD